MPRPQTKSTQITGLSEVGETVEFAMDIEDGTQALVERTLYVQ